MPTKKAAATPAADKSIQIVIAGAGGFIGGHLTRSFR